MNVAVHLHNKIEETRSKLISIGLSEGLNSPEALKTSQCLDKLINTYMRLTFAAAMKKRHKGFLYESNDN